MSLCLNNNNEVVRYDMTNLKDQLGMTILLTCDGSPELLKLLKYLSEKENRGLKFKIGMH